MCSLTSYILVSKAEYCLLLSPHILLSSDTLPAAVQSAGEAATAEVVHANNRPGEEEVDPGHGDVSVESRAAHLQLPPVEGPQDRVQEVAAKDTAALC